MKKFDIYEKLNFINPQTPSLYCFGNYKSKSIFVNIHKLGTTTLGEYSVDSEYFWYANIDLKNDIEIENIYHNPQYSKHQINHIKKIFRDTSTTFYFITKEPNELFLSSFIYTLNSNYEHQIHSKYYSDYDGFQNEIYDFFDIGKNNTPNQLIGYFSELINKFPKKLFCDVHFTPKYIKYINFLTSCIENHNKTISNFKLLNIDDIPSAIKNEFDDDTNEQLHFNRTKTKVKNEFYNEIISGIDFNEKFLSSINDTLISTYYNEEVSIYKLLKTLLPTITFDDSENTDTDYILVDNNDKKDS